MAVTRYEARGNAHEPDGAMCRDARLPWMLLSEIKLHFSDKWACRQSGKHVQISDRIKLCLISNPSSLRKLIPPA